MANDIRPLRTFTTGYVPLASDLSEGEIAFNWADKLVFTKNPAGEIVVARLDAPCASGTGTYTLPTATSSVLGGIKVGANLTITDGVLAAGGGTFSGTVDGGVYA